MNSNENITFNYSEYKQLLLSDIVDIADVFDNDWVFRGQSKYEWDIHTSQERLFREHWKMSGESMESFDRDILACYEKTVLAKIKSSVSYIPVDSRPADDFSWLALLQHHGCKTRLVDFTRSFYIALFFAVSDHFDDDAAIWAISTSAMKRKAENANTKQDNENVFRRKLVEAALSWGAFKPSDLGVTCAAPTQLNKRLIAQQGLFLCPLDFHKTFMENLMIALNLTGTKKGSKGLSAYDDLSNEAKSGKVIKIVINGDDKRNIQKHLQMMNITKATLFPGLDGYCESLNYFALESEI